MQRERKLAHSTSPQAFRLKPFYHETKRKPPQCCSNFSNIVLTSLSSADSDTQSGFGLLLGSLFATAK